LERLAHKTGAPVTFLGHVEDAQQPQWIAACDLMVMDCRSRWFGLEQEGFGIVFIEAAACALAQIAGRSGGSHDAVRERETGLIVDNPRSVNELARAIASLVRDDEERVRLGRRALEVARFDFSWDQLASELSRQLELFDHDRRPAHLA
jgi:phosphatidylinositol alpha-1,6-mannosyltransferase